MSKIHLTVTIGSDARLLPAFLKHYTNCGVENFLVLLNCSSDDNAYRYVRDTLSLYNIRIKKVWTEEFSETLKQRYERELIEKECEYDDWVIYADLDEFQEYPIGIPSFFQFCENEKADTVEGRLIDRVSANGLLLPYDNMQPLSTQYPLGGYITRPLLKAWDKKIAAARAYKTVGGGHHIFLSADGTPKKYSHKLKSFLHSINIHHFKWDASVTARMKSAVCYRDDSLIYWKKEIGRFLEYYSEKGRIAVENRKFKFKSITNFPEV